MEQTTLNRGHLAFVADQVRSAEQAFIAGELDDVVTILTAIGPYIEQWLAATKKPN